MERRSLTWDKTAATMSLSMPASPMMDLSADREPAAIVPPVEMATGTNGTSVNELNFFDFSLYACSGVRVVIVLTLFPATEMMVVS